MYSFLRGRALQGFADKATVALRMQMLVLLVPGPGEGEVDEAGIAALTVLRAMGLPQLVALVPLAPASLQAKAAAKKHALAQLSTQVRHNRRAHSTSLASSCPELPVLLVQQGRQQAPAGDGQEG